MGHALFDAAPVGLASICLVACPAWGDTPNTPPGKSAYHLFHPVPRELMRPLSTDRPDTTESAYTVDAGHFQVEMSLVDYAHDQRGDPGNEQTTRTLAVAPLLLKVGLLHNVDVQLGVDPFTRERTSDQAGGSTQTTQGFGDTLVRLKINLWGNDAGDTALAVMPFVTFPTSGDRGSGNVEGGVIVPLAIALPGGCNLGLMGEIDFVRSSDDDRYVVDFVHTATIGREIWGDLAGYVEYAGFASVSGDENYRGVPRRRSNLRRDPRCAARRGCSRGGHPGRGGSGRVCGGFASVLASIDRVGYAPAGRRRTICPNTLNPR